jgi:hypothetical protein
MIEHADDEDCTLSNPYEAICVGIKRTGQGLRTKYKVKFLAPVDISAYLTDEVLEACDDLRTIQGTRPAKLEDLRKLTEGAEDEDDDDDGSDEEVGEEEEEDEDGDGEEWGEEDEALEEPDDDE